MTADKLTLGEGWTIGVRSACSEVCADVGDPPCWALAGDDADPNTENPMRPCSICTTLARAFEQ
jgi:hypothetical protein